MFARAFTTASLAIVITLATLTPGAAHATVEEGPTDAEMAEDVLPLLFPAVISATVGVYNHLQDHDHDEAPLGWLIAGWTISVPTVATGGVITGLAFAIGDFNPRTVGLGLLITATGAYAMATTIMATVGERAPEPDAMSWQLAPLVNVDPSTGGVTAGVGVYGVSF